MQALSREVFQALRGWRRRNGADVIVALCAAVGFAVNVVVFSATQQFLSNTPRGVRAPGDLVRLSAVRSTGPPAEATTVSAAFSFPAESQIERAVSDSACAAYSILTLDVDWGGDVARERVALVSKHYFEALGVGSLRGEVAAGPSSALQNPDAAVISEQVWRRFFPGGDSPVGSVIRVANRPLTIVGVTAGGYRGLDLETTDVWVAVDSWGARAAGADWRTNDASSWLDVVCRVSGETGANEIAARTAALLKATGAGREEMSILTEPLTRARGASQRRLEMVLVVLSVVSALLLAASCASIGGVLLGRAVSHEREFAVRLAVGADPSALASLVAAEACALLLLIVAVGVAAAALAGHSLGMLALPSVSWPGALLSWQSGIAAAFLLTLLVGVSVVPVMRYAKATSPSAALSAEGLGTTNRLTGIWAWLVGGQIACTALLLSGSFTFALVLDRLHGSLGFDADHTAVLDFAVGGSSDSSRVRAQLMDVALPRIRLLPGVTAAGMGSNVPLRRSTATSMEVAGHGRVAPLSTGGPYFDALDPDAVRALGIIVVRGRLIDSRDGTGARPVMLVNETFARHALGNADPLAACVRVGREPQCRSVIGVVQDMRRENVLERPTLQAIIPIAQVRQLSVQYAVFIRTRTDPAKLRPVVRSLLDHAAIPSAWYEFDALSSLVEPELASWRVASSVFALYTVLALLISASAIIGVLGLVATRRKREFAIRRALGASLWHVLSDVTSGLRLWAFCGGLSGVSLWVVAWSQLQLLVLPVSVPTVVGCGVLAVSVIAALVLIIVLRVTRSVVSTPVDSILRV